MPTNTQHDLQRERLLGAARIQAVADAAGVAIALWGSNTSARVMCSNGQGFIGAIHRGRLPLVEFWQTDDQWERQTPGCGTTRTAWNMRVHVNGPSWQAADSMARGIAQMALAAIRSDGYLKEGGETMGELVATPLGFALDTIINLVQTFSRSDYNTGVIVTPGDPVVVVPGVGGYTVLVPYSLTPNPTVVWQLPAAQRLDNIEVHVLQAWDGVGASVQIGVSGQPALFFSAADSELDVGGETFVKDFDAAGPVDLLVTVAPGTGATQGQVRLQITVTEAGS